MKKIKRTYLLMAIGLKIALLILPGNSLSDDGILEITAQYRHAAPAGIDDEVWQQIPFIQIPIEGRGESVNIKGTVNTKVVYTDLEIFFLLKWNDPTRSIVKQSWQFDGQEWVHMQGNEDRLAILFEVTRIDKFASRGCAVVCHSPPDAKRSQWKLATRSSKEKGDLWHWKAARSDPYGYADDAWLTIAGNPSGSYRETGRRKDAGTGGDINNQTLDGRKPLYHQNPKIEPSAPGFLLWEEATPIEEYTQFQFGTIIPYRLPINPSGSRNDVKAQSAYENSEWELMLSRKLNTFHEDDVQFNPSKRYSFAMAVFDNSGAEHSKATRAMVLRFQRQ